MAPANDTIRAYFSHFSPVSIYHTISNASVKFKSQYNVPSLSPFYYLDPRVILAWLSQPDNFRNFLRVVVVAMVYLLMRQRLDGWLRRISGAPEGTEEVVKRRVAEMKARKREEAGRGTLGRGVGVVSAKGKAEVEDDGGTGGVELKKNK